MSEPLATYIHDHLAGAQLAVEILETMRDRNSDEAFREFARSLLPEIEAEEQLLRELANRIGASPHTVKEAGSWLLEKLSRIKLGHAGSGDFETFESLESLELGIRGRLCLWKALRAVAERDVRLRGIDYDDLIRRTHQQYEQVENARVGMAPRVFLPHE